MHNRPIITGGVYLVVDPSTDETTLLSQLSAALSSQTVKVVQVWDNWGKVADKVRLFAAIHSLTQTAAVPLLVNNDWQLLQQVPAEGIHFDTPPSDLASIRQQLNREVIIGITISNDLSLIDWAHQAQLDYLSFCSVFPSKSVQSCDIVRPETLQAARQKTSLPLFVSGGVTPTNMTQLPAGTFDGVAVISGIMQAPDAQQAAYAFSNAIYHS